MEFIVCPCPETADVLIDGNNQGPNKDANGALIPKQCNTGRHTIALKCRVGKQCSPPDVTIVIMNTNPISPSEVPFQCA